MKIKSLIFTFIISSAVLLTGCSSATETISDDHLSNGTASQETVSTTEPPSPTEEVPADSTAVSTDSTTEALVSSETDPSPTSTTTQNSKSETTGQTAPPQTTTAPHVHRYTSKIVAPTCTSGGYTLYTCSCGAHIRMPWATIWGPGSPSRNPHFLPKGSGRQSAAATITSRYKAFPVWTKSMPLCKR